MLFSSSARQKASICVMHLARPFRRADEVITYLADWLWWGARPGTPAQERMMFADMDARLRKMLDTPPPPGHEEMLHKADEIYRNLFAAPSVEECDSPSADPNSPFGI